MGIGLTSGRVEAYTCHRSRSGSTPEKPLHGISLLGPRESDPDTNRLRMISSLVERNGAWILFAWLLESVTSGGLPRETAHEPAQNGIPVRHADGVGTHDRCPTVTDAVDLLARHARE